MHLWPDDSQILGGEKGKILRVRIYLALKPWRKIENLKKELIDNKGETIHIYNKNDGYESVG